MTQSLQSEKLGLFQPYLIQTRNSHFTVTTPQIMGILNMTPDSFAANGRFLEVNEAVEYAISMVEQGASFIDVGGEPTNPKLNPVIELKTELARVVPLVEALRKVIKVPISVDTSKPEVMSAVLDCGADIINDVRALRMPGAIETVAKYNAAVCLMHMRYPFGVSSNEGEPNLPLMTTIRSFLDQRIQACLAAGIKKENIIIDPGVGAGSFGKTLQQNLCIINHLDVLQEFNRPILIGVSRKTFIGEQLNLPVEERLNGSLAAAIMAISKGARIIRVHDVKQTVEAVAMAVAILQA